MQIDGNIQRAKGNFTYVLSGFKREGIVGADGHHGFKETPIIGSIEGDLTDFAGLNLGELFDSDDVTVTLSLNNGKIIVANEAYYAGDRTGSSEEGVIPVRFEGEVEEA